jgi:RNA polymerase I-specific transcription initiation factor RRN6
VQQIHFAETVHEKGTWFAVRFPISTRIFRPLYHSFSVDYEDGPFDHTDFRNSCLEANPLIDIPTGWTGGFPHADVAFNPWQERQVAIVDRCGNWSIWNIQGSYRRKANWQAESGPSGYLALSASEASLEVSERDHYDGWAAISWVGNMYRLLVCDRRSIALYRVDTEPVTVHPIDLGLKRRSEWILDIKRSQFDPSHLFVLTNTQIFWLKVISDDLVDIQSDGSHEISILLSWRHFRNMEDISLQLAPLILRNGGLWYPGLNAADGGVADVQQNAVLFYILG